MAKAWTCPRWDNRDIPKHYRRWTLDDYKPATRAMLQQFLAGPAWSLYVSGGPGTFKTSLAAAATKAYRMTLTPPWDVWGVLFTTAEYAAQQIRHVGPDTAWWRESAPKCCLFTLDDLGAMRATDHLWEGLAGILRQRYDGNRKTIITSNLSLQDLHKIDARLTDRLMEGVVMQTAAPSARKPQ